MHFLESDRVSYCCSPLESINLFACSALEGSFRRLHVDRIRANSFLQLSLSCFRLLRRNKVADFVVERSAEPNSPLRIRYQFAHAVA